MRNPLLALLLLLTLATNCFSQVEISYTKVRAVVGVKNPQVVKDTILVSDDSVVSLVPAALIHVETDYKFVNIKARLSLFENGTLVELEKNKDWLLVSPNGGTYAIECILLDPEKGIFSPTEPLKIVFGPTPTPDPGPTPGPVPVPPDPVPTPVPTPGNCDNVPPDSFDNMGRKVCKLAAGLPNRKAMAKLYTDAATKLTTDPGATIENVAKTIPAARASLLGTDEIKYAPLVDMLNNDVKQRWPMSKQVLADWWFAVGKGLDNE